MILVVIAGIAVISAATSSGGGTSPPKNFRAASADINQEVRSAIDGGDSPGLSGKQRSGCRHVASGLACFAYYTVKEPTGISADLELIEPTRPIFKALFGIADVQSVEVKVWGPTTSVGGKSSISPLFSLTCDSAANAQIDWNKIDAHGLEQLCDFQQMVKSL